MMPNENYSTGDSNYYSQNSTFLPGPDLSHSYSINTLPSLQNDYVISEDLLAGQKRQGRMSNVRRCFCLFVTFDMLLIGLMWIICIMLDGKNIMTAFNEQIYHYNVHTSLFDIVTVAICRFVVLLLFYGLMSINHWIIVAISTSLSCLFLIGKVFVYDWPHASQPLFQVLLVLISFVLCWGETWFLDFRVLQQEVQAERYLITNTDSERAPLIQRYVHGLPSTYTESMGNFYSPLNSPEGSLYRFQTDVATRKYQPAKFDNFEVEKYMITGKEILERAWNLLNKNDWKLEKSNSDSTVVHSLCLPKAGKIFKVSATLDISPKGLLDELFYEMEKIPSWNSSLLEAQKVEVLDENTDICYQLCAKGPGGVISSRDFVMLRHWEIIDGCYVIASISTEHPNIPKHDKYVRAEHGVGCTRMRTIEGHTDKCYFEFILNMNLKVWIPQTVIDGALVGTLFDYITSLKNHICKLKENRRL